jgi:hypothetical protein
MYHQTQPNSWSCLATAFATVLGIDVNQFFACVGHDGSRIVSGVRRGVHVQEAVDVAWRYGCTVTRIDALPQSDGAPPWPIEFPGGNWPRFRRYVENTQGVLLCRTKSGRGHALTNDMGVLHDPSPGRRPFLYDDLEQQELYPFSLLIVGQRNEL